MLVGRLAMACDANFIVIFNGERAYREAGNGGCYGPSICFKGVACVGVGGVCGWEVCGVCVCVCVCGRCVACVRDRGVACVWLVCLGVWDVWVEGLCVISITKDIWQFVEIRKIARELTVKTKTICSASLKVRRCSLFNFLPNILGTQKM